MDFDDEHPLRGYRHRDQPPDWHPLRDLLGEHLSSFFLWMNAVTFFRGGLAHEYWHRETGRFLDLHEDGRALEYVGGGQWGVVHPAYAVASVFGGWESRGRPSQAEHTMRELRAAHARIEAAHGAEFEPWPHEYGVPFPSERIDGTRAQP